METLTAKQIRAWGEKIGARKLEPDGFHRMSARVAFDLQTTQIQAILEVAAQIADLRETLDPGRLHHYDARAGTSSDPEQGPGLPKGL